MLYTLMRTAAFVVTRCVCLEIIGLPTVAQLPTGTILGVVSDPSEAVVPGAIVTMRDVDTGLTRTVTTGSDGSYRANALPVGHYEIHVSHEGFSAESRTGITLTVAQDATVNITLRLGAPTQNVSVSEADFSVEVTTATLGGLSTTRRSKTFP